MKKYITYWKQIARLSTALLMASALFYACRPDPDYYKPLPTRSGSILNDLATKPDYSLFVQAARRTGFQAALGDGAGIFTVFAPNNQGMQALLQTYGIASVDAAPVPLLRQIVSNHVLNNSLLYPYDLTSFKFNAKKDNRYPTIQGERFLTLNYQGPTNFTVNGVKVTSDVNPVGNGVYYTIDQGLVVQKSADSLINTTANLTEFAKMVNRFKQKVINPLNRFSVSFDGTRVDTNYIFTTTLTSNPRSDANVLTVFAPTNDAIKAFLATTPYSRVEDLPATAVKAIVENHIVPPPDANTYVPARTAASLTPGTTLVTTSGTLTVGTDLAANNIVTPDQVVSNGLVHTINKVLAPTIFNRTYGRAFLDNDLSIWSTIFTRANAPTAFNGNESNKEGYTILAPNNAAFIAAGITADAAANLSEGDAQAIVYGHTVAALNFKATDFVAGTAYRTYAGPTKKYLGNSQFQSTAGKTVSITRPNITGTFGVLHVINGLLDR